MKSNKVFVWTVSAAFLLAVVLRGCASLCMYGLDSVQSPSSLTDMATYIRLAGEICSGKWPDHFDYQPFYYSVFLPFCRIFGGDGIPAAIVLQVVLGGLACVLTGFACRRIFSPRIGIAAAFILAVSRMHVFYTPFMLFEIIQSFWIALLLWLAVLAWDRNRLWLWLLLALVLGLATLTRGNALLFLPGVMWLFFRRRMADGGMGRMKAFLQALPVALVMLLLFELPQLPFSIRNCKYMGRWCGASTAGDKVLALGNTPEAPPGGLEYPLTYGKWVEKAYLKPEEGRIGMASNIMRWILREPFVFAELKWRALLLFWDKQEIANNVSLQREGRACPWLSGLPPFAVTGSLAFMGLLLACIGLFRRKAEGDYGPVELRVFFVQMLLFSWFATALFYNLARFRVASLPLMAAAAGAAAVGIVDMVLDWRKISRDAWMKTGLWIFFSVFFVCFLFSFWQENVEPAFYRKARPQGLLCDFPDVKLLYDHGPLTVGGFRFLEVPPGGAVVEKKLCVPSGIVNARVRIPIMCGDGFAARLEHGGRTYYLDGTNVVEDRFLRWLEVALPEIKSDKFSFSLPAGCAFGADALRDYGRTRIIAAGKSEILPGEAAVEVQWTGENKVSER